MAHPRRLHQKKRLAGNHFLEQWAFWYSELSRSTYNVNHSVESTWRAADFSWPAEQMQAKGAANDYRSKLCAILICGGFMWLQTNKCTSHATTTMRQLLEEDREKWGRNFGTDVPLNEYAGLGRRVCGEVGSVLKS
jgi:hypothetical protein